MTFFVWLGIHIAACIAQGILVGPRPQRLCWSEKASVALWYSIPLSWWLVRGEASPVWFTAGFVLYALGATLLTWARRSNPYFRAAIVMPPEVIRTGPYRWRWMKDPGYWGMTMMGLGSIWMLDARLGYFVLIPYVLILCFRAWKEHSLLYSVPVCADAIPCVDVATQDRTRNGQIDRRACDPFLSVPNLDQMRGAS